jgi:hypothetical protein
VVRRYGCRFANNRRSIWGGFPGRRAHNCSRARDGTLLTGAENPYSRGSIEFPRRTLQLFHHILLPDVVPDRHADERIYCW